MNVSIILVLYKPDKAVLKKVLDSIKNQKFSGKVELMQVEHLPGFAKKINYGIKKAKYDIVVELPQDCIPSDKFWLKKLIEPFKDEQVVASVSKVRLPNELWDNFSLFAKAANIKEKGVITSLLDGKGSAYRKKELKSVGYFDDETFRTAGEDFDMYMKIREKGIIAYPNAEIIHYHPTTYLKRLKKTYQYSNAAGTVLRNYGLKTPKWYNILIKAIPLVGILGTIITFPFKKKELGLFPIYALEAFPDHLYYLLGFWKGFLMGRQTV